MTRKEQIKQASQNLKISVSRADKGMLCREAFELGVEWADANQPSPWISVEERLPEEHTNVIVTDGSNVAHCKKYGDGFYTNVGKCCNVTHWMPIPELPKEEKK
mgnify:CR=1 FL=1